MPDDDGTSVLAGKEALVRIDSAVTSVSWIPSEAVSGVLRLPMDFGLGLHYDRPPPDRMDSAQLELMNRESRFRFANVLRAWIEVDDGHITGLGQEGGGLISATILRFGRREARVPAIGYPDLRGEPEVGDGWVRFTQTTGGRPGVPYPRMVARRPWAQVISPTVWTTLALTVHADGRVTHEVLGASAFPRHWVYDSAGQLVAKSGVASFKGWAQTAFGRHSPWGSRPPEDAALFTAAESAAERQLSTTIMAGECPAITELPEGATLTRQGERVTDVYLVLDGVLDVEVDGAVVAQIGPGAIVGERALLEGGTRTSTLRTRTPVRVAHAPQTRFAPELLTAIAAVHRREDTPASPS